MLHINPDPFTSYTLMQSSHSILWYLCALIMTLPLVSNSALVQVQASLSNQVAGELADYQFTINRNLSNTGSIIVPSALSSNFSVDIEFGTNYDLSSAIPSSGSYSSFAVDSTNLLVKLNYANVTSSTQILFTLSNITNPFVTSIYQAITLKIKNSSSTLVDQGDISLLYTSSTLTQINNWNQNFVPGNITTLSTFQFNFIPDVWKNGKMLLTLAFSKYWTRSLQNTSATTIITSSTKCQPTCVISSKATFTEVQFSTLSINSSLKLAEIKILNVLSPPTVQKIDIVSVSTYDSVSLSVIETGSFLAYSSRPNILQSLVADTKNKIQEPITLSLQVSTMNIFGPNDTITLSLGQQILPSSINVSLFNGIVPSYNYDFLSSREIAFSSFTILSSTFSKMTFTITLEKGLAPVRSTKPIVGNKISIRRNGFLYNEDTFQFNVLPAIHQFPIQVSVSNNFVNFNSTLGLVVSSMRDKVILTDTLSIVVPKEISIYQSSCNPIGCIGCLCNMLLANDSTNQSVITLSNFPAQGIASISVNFQIRNPIFGGQSISICHDDSQKYRIQCFTGSFPAVKQSTLGSRTIAFQSSSDVVYQRSTYTLLVNLTEYALSQGYMLIFFQKGLYLVNTSIVICYVNDEPLCDLTSDSNSDQIVIRVRIIDVNVKIYRVRIQNIRNPLSTQPFQFWIKIFTAVVTNGTSSDMLYYQAQSTFYSVSQALKLTNVQGLINPCKNSQPSILSVIFPNNSLPFNPRNGILVNNPNAQISGALLRTISQHTLWNETGVNISVQNYVSLEPVRYSFLLKTLDLLYDIFSFQLTVKTCEPNTLSITSWKISGLLNQPGQLNFVYDNLLPIDYMLVELPVEYSTSVQLQSNALNTSKISPRVFKLLLSKVQPISIQLWNFTHSSLKSSFFKFSTFKTSSIDNKDYLVAQNLNSIIYDLTAVTNCPFPCKICSSSNSSACLQCYPKQWTENYLLVNGSCTSVCQSGFFLSSSRQVCQRCNLTCLTCDDSKCISCVQFYYFLNGSCLTDCPSKYFPISLNQTCSLCTYPCDGCVNSTTCISCVSPFYLTSSGKCVTNCELNEYAMSNVCRRCEIPCETCSLQLNNCTRCLSGFYFNSGSCLTVCPSPLVPASVNGNNICTSCISPCSTCAMTSTNCTSCISQFKLHQETCITTCPQSFYQASNLCVPCPVQCTVCSSLVNCSICVKNYKLHNSRCIWSCPLMYFSKTITNEQNLNVNGTEVCLPCTNDNRCISCYNQSLCSLCVSGYYLTSGVCVSSCAVTTYADVTHCRNCSSSCLYCVSQTICEVCSSTSNLYQERCVGSCPNMTISVEVVVSVSNLGVNASASQSLSNSSFRTKSCVSCGSMYQNCLVCTNITCSVCKQTYVMDFDRKCRVACSAGYINLNNNGNCIKCDPQCIGCTSVLNNCTQCSVGLIFSITLSVNGSLIRQCTSGCVENQIAYQNQCVSCTAPCRTCTETPMKCTSCVPYNSTNGSANNGSYYLMNGACLTECPEHYYEFQSGCVQCEGSCQVCVKEGCLRCESGYYSSEPYTIGGSTNNQAVEYYECYQSCPQSLPFVGQNRVCRKCSDKCLSCNSQKCLQCIGGYYIYGHYCVLQCPLPLVNFSRSCVNQSDIPVTPEPVDPPVQPSVPYVEPSYFSMPVPFCIGMSVIWLMCLLSKCQHPQTHLSISAYSLCSLPCIAAIVYYFLTFILKHQALSIPATLLLVSLILNYISNFVFIILAKFTLFRDQSFCKNTNARPQYKILMLILAITFTHSNYIIFFSRLFDFSMFKLYIQNINCLRIINYLWGPHILVYLIACIAGILRLLTQSTQGYTFSQTLQHFYQSIDLILVSFIMFLLSILNFKKSKSVYLKQEDWVSTQSTKKVIFDESSNEHLDDNSYESRDEFNICGKNFRVANQQTLMDHMIFPQQSANKLSISSRDASDNYDNIFNDNQSLNQRTKHQIQEFNHTIDEAILIEKHVGQQQMSRQEAFSKFGLSRTVDIKLREQEMGQELQEMKTVNENDLDLDQVAKVASELIQAIPKESEQDSQQLIESVVQSLICDDKTRNKEARQQAKQISKQDDGRQAMRSQQRNQTNQEAQTKPNYEEQPHQGEGSLSKVIEQSQDEQIVHIIQENNLTIDNSQLRYQQLIPKDTFQDYDQKQQTSSIQNKNTAIQFSIHEHSLQNPHPSHSQTNINHQNHQSHIQILSNDQTPTNIQIIPSDHTFQRQSLDSSPFNSLKSNNSNHKNHQSSPKIHQKPTSSTSIHLKSSKLQNSPRLSNRKNDSPNHQIKVKKEDKRQLRSKRQAQKKRYRKSPGKTVFLPGQNFSTVRQLSKLQQSSRISGLYTLFENDQRQNNLNEEVEDFAIRNSDDNQVRKGVQKQDENNIDSWMKDKISQMNVSLDDQNVGKAHNLEGQQLGYRRNIDSGQQLSKRRNIDSGYQLSYRRNIDSGQQLGYDGNMDQGQDFSQNMVLEPQRSLPLKEQFVKSPQIITRHSKIIGQKDIKKQQAILRYQQSLNYKTAQQDLRPSQNVRFYLQLDQPQNINQPSLRKSKSFSPNSLKNHINTQKHQTTNHNSPLKIVQTHKNHKKANNSKGKQNPTKSTLSKNQINQSQDKISTRTKQLVKSPQYDMIDYKKARGKNQTEKNNNLGVGSVIAQIERKQKVKSRQKKLQGIYGNKNNFN